MDRSERDSWYFIDGQTYNCPYCKRRNIRYHVLTKFSFDWDNERRVFVHVVICTDCTKESIHLGDWDIELSGEYFQFNGQRRKDFYTQPYVMENDKYELTGKLNPPIYRMDDLFFAHLPGSQFSTDTRIPTGIREALEEASNCHQSNYLTGASACLRKSIYKLLQNQEIATRDKNGSYLNYEDRLKLLKAKLKSTHPHFDNQLVDWLDDVQGITSIELHENDWVDLDGGKLRFLISVMHEVLEQVYIVPDLRESTRMELSKMAKQAGSSRSADEKG